jgi:multiple sugar transport system permease protein
MRKVRSRTRDRLAALLFLTPQTVGLFLFTLMPICFAFVIGLYNWEMLVPPRFTGLANFIQLIHDSTFYESMWNTVFYLITYLPINIVLSLLFAVLLTRFASRTSSFFQGIYFMPIIIPTVAVALVFKFLYQFPRGLVTSILAILGIAGPNWMGDPSWAMFGIVLMSVWKFFGYNLVILIAAIREIPKELLEAASIDGAGSTRKFVSIMLPLITPALFFAIVMTTIFSFQVFEQAFVMTGGGPANATTTIVMYIYQNGFTFFKMGYAAAISVVVFLIIAILTLIQWRGQRFWVHYQ